MIGKSRTITVRDLAGLGRPMPIPTSGDPISLKAIPFGDAFYLVSTAGHCIPGFHHGDARIVVLT